jgi:DNA-binding response OmpR family regulator
MPIKRVLIVEDEPIIAACVESELQAAGYDVCGIAASQHEALRMADACKPHFAVVDVHLAPGNGKKVARELADRFNTVVLMATADDVETLHGIGAEAVLPKPYEPGDVPRALKAAEQLAAGEDPRPLPDNVKPLARDGLNPRAPDRGGG